MKFSSFVFLAALPCVASTVSDKLYANSNTLGPSMWVFGTGGVGIYSNDGTSLLKEHSADSVCHEVVGSTSGESTVSCSFYDVVSDGKKYVWAAVTRGVSKIDVFSIDTGDIAGSFETCNSPRDLEYHPLRDEIWVRCGYINEDEFFGEQTHMDVLSASAPGSGIVSQILLKTNVSLSAYGYSVIESSLGDVGYTSIQDEPYLAKIDLSSRTVIGQFPLPLAIGGSLVAYSRVNHHIYIESNVCCSCGFEGSDLGADCGRYTPYDVEVTTGPNAGFSGQGFCGSRCGGSLADVVGVLEFDTKNDTFVGAHTLKEGGSAAPYASPDGSYIVLIGPNGGTSIRILKPQSSGEQSTVVHDLELGFSTEGVEADQVFSDFAFVQTDDLNLIVFGSGSENAAAIVDMSSGTPVVSKVQLTDNAEVTARGSSRNVEWAIGTDYVWIDGRNAAEVYVLDVRKQQVVNTITGPEAIQIVYINNYERESTAALLNEMIEAKTADAVANDEVVSQVVSQLRADSDDDSNVVSIAALVMASIAFIVGVLNLVQMSNNKSQVEAAAKVPDSGVSIGSKSVA